VLIAVTSSLTSERNHSHMPNEIEFVSVKVSWQFLSLFVICYYITPGSDLIIYEHRQSAI